MSKNKNVESTEIEVSKGENLSADKLKELLRNNPKLLKDVMNSPEIIGSLSLQVQEMSAFSGPIPDPKTMMEYGAVGEDFPERILSMAEKQSSHRQELEKSVVKSNILNEKIGMVFGFIIVIFVIAIGGYLVYLDKIVTGFASILLGLTSVVGVFVYSKKQEESMLKNKDSELIENKKME